MFLDFSQNFSIDNLIPKTDYEQKVKLFLEDWFSTSQTVSVQTSGSTGHPKVFEIEKYRMENSAKKTCDFLDLKKGDSALVCLPIEYISGKMMLVRAILRQLKLYVVEPSLHPLQNLTKTIDFCALTPLQVGNSLDKIHLIKNLIIGGASVSDNLKDKIKTLLKQFSNNTRIFETYGMSETLSHIALKSIFPVDDGWFTCFEGVIISLDQRGCLTIDSPDINSELLITNDFVEIKNINKFRFLGRIDNVINSGGAKIFPETLEDFAKKYLHTELLFVGIPDVILGQKLVLIIESSENDDCSHQTIEQKVYQIPFEKSFHRPKEIYFIDKLPRTPNGKLDRTATVSWVQSIKK